MSLKFVDLYAGCGGLSLGLLQAGFKLVLAVEKSSMAAETYYHNLIERIDNQEWWTDFSNPGTGILDQAKKGIVVKNLCSVLNCSSLLTSIRRQGVDLVVGGPPCQGFSLAGKRNPKDKRNKLVWEFLSFVEKIRPKAVVIENVPGLINHFEKHDSNAPFDQLRRALETVGSGYLVQSMCLNAMHFGVPQHRPRIFLVAVRRDVAKKLTEYSHEEIWYSAHVKAHVTVSKPPALAPKATYFGLSLLTVQDAISDINNLGYSRKKKISEFAKEMRTSKCPVAELTKKDKLKHKLENHELRRHCDRVTTRFRLYQVLSRQGISASVLTVGNQQKRQLKELLDSDLVFPLVAPDGTIVARTSRGLSNLIRKLSTKKHSQRALKWKCPSPTILSVPDDLVHPKMPRALTVRETARIQSFPDCFEFRSKVTTGGEMRRYEVPQYTQVGNAVPPKLAKAIGLVIRSALRFPDR